MKLTPEELQELHLRIDGLSKMVEGCQVWIGYVDARPTLQIRRNGKRHGISVRRIQYCRTGRKDPGGRYVLPTCGNPLCIHPDHLQSISQAEHLRRNAQPNEALRAAKITAHRRAVSKINPEAVAAIRASGASLTVVAAEHGVTPSLASKIRRHEIWTDALWRVA